MYDWWIWFLVSFTVLFCLLSAGGAARRRQVIRRRRCTRRCSDAHCGPGDVYVVRMDCHHPHGYGVYPAATAPYYPQPPIPARTNQVGAAPPPGVNPYSAPPPNYDAPPRTKANS